jgi:hypothetical protein
MSLRHKKMKLDYVNTHAAVSIYNNLISFTNTELSVKRKYYFD